MFISTIIPTIGRPTLKRTVWSVINQELPSANFEIIVVNDSGHPLQAADWQNSDRVSIINTQHRERSVARNTGAAIARGKYLHFLDDDDWLLPGALSNLTKVARESNAAWVYGSSQLVNGRDQHIINLVHELTSNCFIQVMSGEWIPLQASLINQEYFILVGGFKPTMIVSEDVDLCRRITLNGDIKGTQEMVACVGMRTELSSTRYDFLTKYSRAAREEILNKSGVFLRMLDSAQNSSNHQHYWFGRIVRAYLTSSIWDINHLKVFTAISRSVFSLLGLIVSLPHIFFIDFWKAIAKPYSSFAFERGCREKRLEQQN